MKQRYPSVAYPIPKQKHSQQRGKRLEKTRQGDSYMVTGQDRLGGGSNIVLRVALGIVAVCDKTWERVRRR